MAYALYLHHWVMTSGTCDDMVIQTLYQSDDLSTWSVPFTRDPYSSVVLFQIFYIRQIIILQNMLPLIRLMIRPEYRYTYTIRYIGVIHNTIVHTAQQLQWQNLGQTLHSRTTPIHTSPLRASYGVSFVSYSKKNDRDISRAHTIYICIYIYIHQNFTDTLAGDVLPSCIARSLAAWSLDM